MLLTLQFPKRKTDDNIRKLELDRNRKTTPNQYHSFGAFLYIYIY